MTDEKSCPRFEVFGAQGYYVYVLNDEVTFKESSPVWGGQAYVRLRRPVVYSPFGSPGTWGVTRVSPWGQDSGVSLGVLRAMFDFVEREYGANFEPYKGSMIQLNARCDAASK